MFLLKQFFLFNKLFSVKFFLVFLNLNSHWHNILLRCLKLLLFCFDLNTERSIFYKINKIQNRTFPSALIFGLQLYVALK